MSDSELTRIINNPKTPQERDAAASYQHKYAKKGAATVLPDCQSDCAQDVTLKQLVVPKEFKNRNHAAAIAFLQGRQQAIRTAKQRSRFKNISSIAENSRIVEQVFQDQANPQTPDDEEKKSQEEAALAYLKEAQELIDEAQKVLESSLADLDEHRVTWLTKWLDGCSVPEIHRALSKETTQYRIRQTLFKVSQHPPMQICISKATIFGAEIWEYCTYGTPSVKRMLLEPPSDRG